MPALYRTLVLDNNGLLDLLACGRLISRHDSQYTDFIAENPSFKEARIAENWGRLPPPSERWRESLVLARRLTIQGPLLAKTLLLLWSVCQSDLTLFPNTAELRVCDSSHGREIGRRLDECRQCDTFPPRGELLFNASSYCGGGLSAGPALLRLPSSGFKAITFHSSVPDVSYLPKAWDSCTCVRN